MGKSRRNGIIAGLVALASHASAQVASVCPTNDVCFKLNIPESTASSDNGDIFFQISAPSTYEWVALGQGTGMSGSNIFVVYTAGNGNVTLSPRLGTGHTMPTFNSNAQATLLEGSGVTNGKMVANVRCASCNTWSGGSASFSENKGNWIYGFRSAGGAKDTTSQSASIAEHSEEEPFEWSYASAKGGNSVNPLLNSSPSGTGVATGTTSCVPRPASTAGAGSGSTSGGSGTSATSTAVSSSDDDENYTGSGRPTAFQSEGGHGRPTSAPTGGPQSAYKRDDESINYCDENSDSGFTLIGSSGRSQTTKMVTAHAVLAALAFVIFFPVGAIVIRVASFTGVVWFHAAFQVFGYLVFVAAFGVGVYIANNFELLHEAHPVIGIVVFVVLFFQPILGFIHHSQFNKHQSRTVWSHGHIWLGRIAITLGIINGGLGFQLADRMGMGSRPGMIAYAVIAAVIWLAWVAASVFGASRRKQARKNVVADKQPTYRESESPREGRREGQSAVDDR
ncbi:CBD9-like protein [Massarina eburnea CBS 473.64]|uniref:CBD9-like protein n=1 Tax=Massarina eburnea CBS 473.64 TaxID=1395130 RepID=A0A6A6RSR4_9PLEO|nr:CBD9-like protein [Massarina eburnea CBS 473.64]